MNSNPLFSVIVPTYHRNDLLAKCLDRLAPGIQTLSAQYEVIVTDDGFKTTAQEMISQNYPWVKWIAGLGKGPAANRNNGARYACGQWLVFTDDDCLPSSTWLEAFAAAITPDIYVYEGKTTCEIGIRSPLEHAPINLTGGYLWSCNMAIQAKVFHDLGKFDESFPNPHMEDVDMRERIKAAGYSILFVEAVVDHPPRILPWGNKLGAGHESEIFYWHQKRNQYLPKTNLLTPIVKFRLKAILNYPPSLVSLLAIFSLFAELSYTLLKMNIWYQKYPCDR